MTVNFRDPVYGEITFTEPLLAELYRSQAVQRLGGIYQGGVTAFVKPERATTRLEHSLGVAALLRLWGADVVTQAAGLLHDVPHTAFSHVIDFVYPNREHTYHEAQRERFIAQTDLPAILARYGLDWREVTDAERFPLLEQPLPALCADRLDYFLRDGVVDMRHFSAATARRWLAHVRVWQGRLVVDDPPVARQMADAFITLDDRSWCSVQEVGWYAVVARALRLALERGFITRRDFDGTDAPLWARLHRVADPEVQHWLSLLRPEVTFERTTHAPELEVLPKVRAIDPPVLVRGRAVPLSSLDEDFARRRASYLRRKRGPWGLRILGIS